MNFKQEFLTQLRSGADFHALMAIVRKHEPHFESLRPMYDALQEIWLDYGFDNTDTGGPLQDDLEYVMEKVWYGCPAEQKA